MGSANEPLHTLSEAERSGAIKRTCLGIKDLLTPANAGADALKGRSARPGQRHMTVHL